MNNKHISPGDLRSFGLFSLVLLIISITATAASDDSEPGTSPPPAFDFPDLSSVRQYHDPVCANNMNRSEVAVFNESGTRWYYYTCTFKDNGWCSLSSGHCPSQICHPYTDWIGPWNNHVGRDQPNRVSHYTCISVTTAFPFRG